MNDKVEVVIVDGKVRCIYINDYRVVGSKPYVSENPQYTTFQVPIGKIRAQLKRKPRSKA